MFRVTFLTDDKRLPKALRLLDGLAYELTVAPITNVAPQGKGVVEAPADILAMAKELPDEFTTKMVAEVLKKHKRPFKTSAVGNFVKALLSAKLIKRQGHKLIKG